ncbi:bifunctional phosphoglucose/phosphomannose isomerase [soil metagenome]
MAASPSESTGLRLDPDTIAAVDASDMLADIAGLPEHLRDALWKAESANLKPWDSPGGLVVAGMGGSAVGGALARAMLGDHASRPILAARAYGLPVWTTPDTTVLCASYSGDTEETLVCYEAAGALGAKRVAVTSGGKLAEIARADGVPVIPVAGGFQPRAAVAYMTVAALEVARLCGAGPRMGAEIDVAADHLEQLVVEWGAEGAEDCEAKSLARALHDSVPVIAGAGLTSPIAYRWKTQFNENAKIPAFTHELPELCHNEVVGWTEAPALGRFAAIFLDDSDTHPRIKERIALTRELIGDAAAGGTHVVHSRGDIAVERVLSLVLLGDLVSFYVAVLRGTDPTPVDVLVTLKERLAGTH